MRGGQLVGFGLPADLRVVERAVELVEDLHAHGLLDVPLHVELTRLAVALDEAAQASPSDDGGDPGELVDLAGARGYELALCRFFARLAQVLAGSVRGDAYGWFAGPRGERRPLAVEVGPAEPAPSRSLSGRSRRQGKTAAAIASDR